MHPNVAAWSSNFIIQALLGRDITFYGVAGRPVRSAMSMILKGVRAMVGNEKEVRVLFLL